MKYTPEEAKFAIEATQRTIDMYKAEIDFLQKGIEDIKANTEASQSFINLLEAWENSTEEDKDRFFDEHISRLLMGI